MEQKPAQELVSNQENIDRKELVVNLIKEVDFEIIKGSLRTILLRSGLTEDQITKMLEKVDADYIVFKSIKDMGSARWDATAKRGKVVLNENGFSDVEEAKLREFIISNVIHEFVHTLAQTERQKFFSLENVSGLKHRDNTADKSAFQGINEAVTDMIALVVYEQYAQSKGLGRPLNSYEAYAQEKNYFDVFATVLAEYAGVPKDVIIAGFVQAYFSKKKELYEFMNLMEKELVPDTLEKDVFEHTKRMNQYNIRMNDPSNPPYRNIKDKYPNLSELFKTAEDDKRKALLDSFMHLL